MPAEFRRSIVVVCAGIVVVVAVCLYAQSPPAFLDLDVYRKGVQAWWHGKDMYGTLPMTIGHSYLPFIYPPFAILVLGPLAALPWTVSAIVMLALSLVSLTVVVHVSVRQVWPYRGRSTVTAVVVALSLATEPVWDTLWFGQVNLLLMLLVALDCLPARTRWPRGLLVGIAAAVKLTPAVFVLYFLLRKDYRAAATATITALAATAVGFLVSWRGSLQFWFGSDKGARSISGSPYYSNQSIDGFLARLSLPHETQTALWLMAVCVVLVVAIIGIRRAHRMGNNLLAMSITGCLGLMASPTSWGHHWVYIVPGAIAMGGYAVQQRNVRRALVAGIVVVVFVLGPYQFLPSGGTSYTHWAWWQHVVGNSYILVGVTLLSVFASVGLDRRQRASRHQERPPTSSSRSPILPAAIGSGAAGLSSAISRSSRGWSPASMVFTTTSELT